MHTNDSEVLFHYIIVHYKSVSNHGYQLPGTNKTELFVQRIGRQILLVDRPEDYATAFILDNLLH